MAPPQRAALALANLALLSAAMRGKVAPSVRGPVGPDTRDYHCGPIRMQATHSGADGSFDVWRNNGAVQLRDQDILAILRQMGVAVGPHGVADEEAFTGQVDTIRKHMISGVPLFKNPVDGFDHGDATNVLLRGPASAPEKFWGHWGRLRRFVHTRVYDEMFLSILNTHLYDNKTVTWMMDFLLPPPKD
uniref:Phospholipase B-like n=1 Tax=Zooxanthella nutricula TaxID=1333877 RepID=A0A7S2P272_9DINO